jgi:hypothetical protein
VELQRSDGAAEGDGPWHGWPRGGEQRGEEGVATVNGETLGRAAAVAVL